MYYMIIVQDFRSAMYQFSNVKDISLNLIDYFKSFRTSLFVEHGCYYTRNWLGIKRYKMKFKPISIDEIIILAKQYFCQLLENDVLKEQDNAPLDLYYEDTKIHKNLGGEKTRNEIKIYFMEPQNETQK